MSYVLNKEGNTLRFGEGEIDYPTKVYDETAVKSLTPVSNYNGLKIRYVTENDTIISVWDNALASDSYNPESLIDKAMTAELFDGIMLDVLTAFLIDDNDKICGYELLKGDNLNEVYARAKARWESPFLFGVDIESKDFDYFREKWLTFYNLLMDNTVDKPYFFIDMNLQTLSLKDDKIYPINPELVLDYTLENMVMVRHIEYKEALTTMLRDHSWSEITE